VTSFDRVAEINVSSNDIPHVAFLSGLRRDCVFYGKVLEDKPVSAKISPLSLQFSLTIDFVQEG